MSRSSTRKSVVFVDHSGDPGGGQLGLMRYIANREHLDVAVIFFFDGPVVERIRQLGVHVIILAPGRRFSMGSMVSMVPRLTKALRSLEFDVVIANSLYAGASLSAVPRRSAPRRVYYSRVSMWSLRGAKRALAMTAIFPRFDAFLANSKWTAQQIPARLRKPVRVAYPVSGIDASPPRREVPPCSGDEVTIATLSRPDRWKGIHLVIEATKDLKSTLPDRKVDLKIFGGTFFSDRVYIAELDAAAADSSIDIRRLGHVDDVAGALAGVDVLVVPTLQPEPFGQVVPQGMASGCVVVVSDQGGPLELIEDGVNGATFISGNAEDLRSVLRGVVEDRRRSAELSAAAQTLSIAFADITTSRALEAAIIELVEEIDELREK